MKTRIVEIKPNLHRVYYSIFGGGEASVPFETEIEAKAFEKGLKYAFDDVIEAYEKRNKVSSF